MDIGTWIVVAVIAAVLIVGAAWWLMSRQRRTEQLTERYGPEYERMVNETGSQAFAERELQARDKRMREYEIRALEPDERDEYATAWRAVQAEFVDDPSGAIAAADRLVQRLLTARGYAVGDFEQRAADVSVDHAQVVHEYRAAHEIAERHAIDGVDTEQLRQAMVHYRTLFDELLEVRDQQPVEAPS